MPSFSPIDLWDLLQIDEQADSALLEKYVQGVGLSNLNRFAHECKRHVAKMNVGQLAKLTKVFTRMEICIPTFCAGSTSVVYLLLMALEQNDPDLAREIRAWAFHTTRNPYVPFGAWRDIDGAPHSLIEYDRMKAEQRLRAMAANETRHDQALQRKAGRAAAHAGRVAVQGKRNAERAALISALGDLLPIDRLDAISRDGENPPYFYLEEFAEIDDAALASLDPAIRANLKEALVHAPRGAWRRLEARL